MTWDRNGINRPRYFLPLFGARVLVTRAAEQAPAMVEALREAGAEAVVIPMIRLAPPEDFAPIDAALARLEDYDAILFTSANAVRFLVARAAELARPLLERSPAVACVGSATADAAREAGFSVAVTPESRHDAEGLLAAVENRRLHRRGRRHGRAPPRCGRLRSRVRLLRRHHNLITPP